MQYYILSLMLFVAYNIHRGTCGLNLQYYRDTLLEAGKSIIYNKIYEECSCICGAIPKRLSIEEMVEEEGYSIETHEVTTADSYCLTIHRILCSQSGKHGSKVVLLQHGLLGSSEDFVYLKRDYGLAYLMADAGYDVWMGNNRGNCYSRKHLNCDPDETEEYWDFNLDDLALFDMTAIIDYVLQETSQSSLNYVGYSQGSTLALILCALEPKYNEKIHFHAAVSPIVYLQSSRSPLIKQISKAFTDPNIEWTSFIGKNEFCPKPCFLDTVQDDMCQEEEGPQLCDIPRFLLSGFTPSAIRLKYDLYQYCACSTSIDVIKHFTQILTANEFQRYDYGLQGNTEKYGQSSPPPYNFDQITHRIAPIFHYIDYFSYGLDVDRFIDALPNKETKYKVNSPLWTHLDYILNEYSRDTIYKQILLSIESYS